MQCMLMLQYMIPLCFKKGQRSQKCTHCKLTQFIEFHRTCLKQVSLKSGSLMSPKHRGNSSIRTLTESSRYLHTLYSHELSGLCCTVAQESALLGYDATSLGNQFPAFWSKVMASKQWEPLVF
jgi:hypothetical protein